MLDDALCVIVASRFFYQAFAVTPSETEGRPLYELGNGQRGLLALALELDTQAVAVEAGRATAREVDAAISPPG